MELKLQNVMESELLNSSSYSITLVEDVLTRIIKNAERYDPAVIKWIIVRTLRILAADFKDIKSVNKVNFLKMIDAALKYNEGQSLQDIFGEVEFFGEIFKIVPGVFIPRMSTEALVRTVLKTILPSKRLRILDLCSGSGAMSIVLAKYLRGKVTGLDVSEAAIDTAKQNAREHHVLNVSFIQGDIFESRPDFTSVDVIVSNPPYWSKSKVLEANIDMRLKNGYEAGETGYEYIEAIITLARKKLFSDGYLFLEVDHDQVDETIKLMDKYFSNIKVEKDYRGLNRVVHGKLKSLKEVFNL